MVDIHFTDKCIFFIFARMLCGATAAASVPKNGEMKCKTNGQNITMLANVESKWNRNQIIIHEYAKRSWKHVAVHKMWNDNIEVSEWCSTIWLPIGQVILSTIHPKVSYDAK